MKNGRPIGTELIGPIDLTVDGADEVDQALNLIKGRGGALFREKLVAAASKRFVVIIDESKVMKKLGVGVLPVEVSGFLWRTTAHSLATLATSMHGRGGAETTYMTDNGNLILDVTLADGIDNAPALAAELKAMVGVVEHGLFIGLTDTCIVGDPDGPLVVGRQSGAAASL